MVRPVRHGNKWRVRWTDSARQRSSKIFTKFKTAAKFATAKNVEMCAVRKVNTGRALTAKQREVLADAAHTFLDMTIARYVSETKRPLCGMTVLELMQWSFKQTQANRRPSDYKIKR